MRLALAANVIQLTKRKKELTAKGTKNAKKRKDSITKSLRDLRALRGEKFFF